MTVSGIPMYNEQTETMCKVVWTSVLGCDAV